MDKNLHITDQDFQDYIDFLLKLIEKKQYRAYLKMEKTYIPIVLNILKRETRYIEYVLEFKGFPKQFTWFLSRNKSPEELLNDLQEKIDMYFNEIIDDNDIDKKQLKQEYSLFCQIIKNKKLATKI